MSEFRFTEEQQLAIDKRGSAVLVSAAAGSGKTRVIVERLMSYLLDAENGRNVDEFLIITFTRAAASELKTRVLEGLSEALSKDPGNRNIRRQSELVRRSHISTIHSFCTDVLREYAHKLEIPADFRVLDDTESDIIKYRSLEKVFEDRYSKITETSAFAQLVDLLSAGRDDSKLVDIVLDAHRKIQCHPFPEKWVKEQIEMLDTSSAGDVGNTVWGEYILRRGIKTAEYCKSKLEYCLDELAVHDDLNRAYGDSLRAMYADVCGFIKDAKSGWDEAAKYEKIAFPSVKPIKEYEDVKSIRTSVRTTMDSVFSSFSCKSGELISDMELIRPAVTELLNITLDFDRQFSEDKLQRRALDFNDLEHLCVKLFVDPDTLERTEAAKEVSKRFAEIMVDEYQDVNEVQELIFSAVSKEERNLFLVGDVKQSIYRFRLADPAIFLKKYGEYKDVSEAEPGEPSRIILSANFRSRKEILDAVNYVFKNIMSVEFGGMEYTEREQLNAGRNGNDPDFPAVELNVTDVVFEDSDEEMGRVDADALYIASRISTLLREKTMIPDGNGFRALRPSDIAILLQAMKNKAYKYAAALSEYGIPSSMPGGESFFESPEIAVMLSVLSVIDNPRQDIPLISAMRSPLWGFTADELSAVRLCGGDSFYDSLCAMSEHDAKCNSFLSEINTLRAYAPNLSSDKLLWKIYSDTNAEAIFGAMQGGEKRRRNLIKLYELSESFEANGYKGLFRFRSMLQSMQDNGKEPFGDSADDGSDSVKIMSIHKSKGLEFPVVVIGDMFAQFNLKDSQKPLLIHQNMGVGAKITDTVRRISYPSVAHSAVAAKITEESLFEELRVLYVAMTRAREKLIMSVTVKGAESKLRKLKDLSRSPVEPEVLRSVKTFADLVLLASLQRPDMQCLFGEPEIENGWRASYIRSSEIQKEEPDVILLPMENGAVTDESVCSFAETHSPCCDVPSKMTATELKGKVAETEAAEDADEIGYLKAGRPALHRPDFIRNESELTGAEKGTALHLAMQYIDYEKCQSDEGVEAELSRLHNSKFLTDKQRKAIDAGKIRKFFDSGLGREVISAEKINREVKLSLLVNVSDVFPEITDSSEKILFQGVCDLYIENGNEITVIDFKTDYVTDSTIQKKISHYSPQIEAYGKCLERMTGKKVIRKVLYFFSIGKYFEI